MIFWLISKLPLWIIKLLPWVVVIVALVFIVNVCLALDELRGDLVKGWLS